MKELYELSARAVLRFVVVGFPGHTTPPVPMGGIRGPCISLHKNPDAMEWVVQQV